MAIPIIKKIAVPITFSFRMLWKMHDWCHAKWTIKKHFYGGVVMILIPTSDAGKISLCLRKRDFEGSFL